MRLCGRVVCESVVCGRVVCVKELCVSKLRVGGRTRREERTGGGADGSAQTKTRTPHKDVGNKHGKKTRFCGGLNMFKTLGWVLTPAAEEWPNVNLMTSISSPGENWGAWSQKWLEHLQGVIPMKPVYFLLGTPIYSIFFGDNNYKT